MVLRRLMAGAQGCMSCGLRVLCGIVDDVRRGSVSIYWSDRRMGRDGYCSRVYDHSGR